MVSLLRGGDVALFVLFVFAMVVSVVGELLLAFLEGVFQKRRKWGSS
jgi:hypothetical protein